MSLAVEGKAGESFASTIGEWRTDASDGKTKRLEQLCELLGINAANIDDSIRYQLLHRSVSALIEAERIGAQNAAMVVLSFSKDVRSKSDFGAFVQCLGVPNQSEGLIRIPSVRNHQFYVGWLDVPVCSDADIAAVAA
jgi:hypothetical protein